MKRSYKVMIVLLIMQLFLYLGAGARKNGWFVDEVFTLSLSNSENAFLTWNAPIIENWVDGDDTYAALSVTEGNQFDFSTVTINQGKDVHPPLYYYMIHSVFSLFPGVISKWFGLLPNILFCLMTTVTSFLLMRKLKIDDKFSLLICAMWAFSVGGATTAVLIRMYAMLTWICTLFVYAHVDLVEKKTISWKAMIFLFLITLSGIMTQYYFLIVCFFLCGAFFFYWLFSKKYIECVKYVAVEFSALFSSFMLFPRMSYHLFEGYRGTEAISNLTKGQDIFRNIEKVIELLDYQLFGGCMAIVFIACVVLLILFNRKLRNEKISKSIRMLIALSTVLAGYVLLVAKIAPFQSDRYYMCIYPLICIVFLGIAALIFQSVLKNQKAAWGLFVSVVLVFLVQSYRTTSIGYLYTAYDDRYAALENYYQYPLIALNGADWNESLDEWALEYIHYPSVFRCSMNGSFSGLEKAKNTKDLSNGFVLYLSYLDLSENELVERISEYFSIDSYHLVYQMPECTVYYFLPNSY